MRTKLNLLFDFKSTRLLNKAISINIIFFKNNFVNSRLIEQFQNQFKKLITELLLN